MKELITTKENLSLLQLTASVRRTLELLVQDDKLSKAKMIAHYTVRNSPNFNILLKDKERLPDLVKMLGLPKIGKIVMVEITKFINSYTVVRPMNDNQISDCALAIIQSAEEDRLSLQDLVLFFEGAKQGKYGRVLDHIDQHVIFEMLEKYREDRHTAYLSVKDEIETSFKGLGDANRSSENYKEAENDIRAEIIRYYGEQTLKQH